MLAATLAMIPVLVVERVSSRSVKSDRAEETAEVLEVLRRLEADVAELKRATASSV